MKIVSFIILLSCTVERIYFGDFAIMWQRNIKIVIQYYDFCWDRDSMQKSLGCGGLYVVYQKIP
jgi:hypothetical protein